MEKKMETTILYRAMLGLYWDKGKENRSYYGFRGLGS